MRDLLGKSAWDIASAVSAQEVSAVEVATASLAAIENDPYRCFLASAGDAAIQAAEDADRRARDGVGGALLGVPVAVKDLTDVQGLPTSLGLANRRYAVAATDAAVVTLLRKAGAVIVGKTNTSALGMLGETRNRLGRDCSNPWDTDRTPGGSSGGSAAAVAAGMVPAATGTDSAGSITAPAALCGIVGIRPSHGRVSTWPVAGDSGVLNDIGPLVRTVRDAALMLSVMAGPDPRDPMCLTTPAPDFLAAVDSVSGADQPLKGMRIAWSPGLGHFPVDSDVLDVVVTTLPHLTYLGATLAEDQPRVPHPFEIYMPLCAADARIALRGISTGEREELFEESLRELAEFPDIGAADFVVVLHRLSQMRAVVSRFFEDHDLMVMPATAVTAFGLRTPPSRIGGVDVAPGWTTATPFSAIWNMTGHPTMSVPCGVTADGLPVGVMLVGRKGDEISVLRAAAALETVAPWVDLPHGTQGDVA